MSTTHQQKFEIHLNPSQTDLAVIQEGLNAFNLGEGISAQKDPIAVFVRDEHEQIQGGLYGNIAWNWLHTRWLWISASLRGQGIAGILLEMAEAHAREKGCTGAYIDTFSPDALRVYMSNGYRKFGELQDFPPGRTRTFLQKQFTTDPKP